MRVVITGGREFVDFQLMFDTLDMMQSPEYANPDEQITEIAHGDQKAWMPLSKRWRGADYWAGQWAGMRGIPQTPFPVSEEEWRRYHKAAGPIRNRRMIDTFKPDRVIAFPGNKGTRDCITYAVNKGIEVVGVEVLDNGVVNLKTLTDPRLF